MARLRKSPLPSIITLHSRRAKAREFAILRLDGGVVSAEG